MSGVQNFCTVLYVLQSVHCVRSVGKDVRKCMLIHTFKVCPGASAHCIFDFSPV